MLITLIINQNFIMAHFYFSLALIIIIIITIIVIIDKKVSKNFNNLNYKMDYYSFKIKIIIINNINLIINLYVIKAASKNLHFINFTLISLNIHINLIIRY